MDPLICFNRHKSFLGLTPGGHFVYHVTFTSLYLESVKEMAVRILIYELGWPSYGELKLKKYKNFTKKIV